MLQKLADLSDLPMKLLRIPPEDINALECIEFSGTITLIDNYTDFNNAVGRILSSHIVGFDTESRPAFIKGQKFPVSIIQISLEEEAFIFRLKNIGIPKELLQILSSPSLLKIGVGVADDIKRLQDMVPFKPNGFVDLSDIAKKKGLIQSGARALTARYLGKKLVKSSQKTNWAKSGLTERQLRYAATDAWVCLHILNPLNADDTDYFALREAELERLKNECQDVES